MHNGKETTDWKENKNIISDIFAKNLVYFKVNNITANIITVVGLDKAILSDKIEVFWKGKIERIKDKHEK